MRKWFLPSIAVLFLLTIAISVGYVWTQEIAVLDPKGSIAIKQRALLLHTMWIMLIVVIPVFLLLFAFAWRYRAGHKTAKYTPNWAHSHLAEILWWGIPFIIILLLAVITWESSHELNPYKPLQSEKKPLKIQVIALDWKWLFLYPEQSIATVNFIQFPVDTPLEFVITAEAPMNSFWIPELGGQIYAMPGMATQLHLIANEEGEFRGNSANFSGKGFAGMTFVAKATSEEAFNDWVQSIQNQSSTLGLKEYNALAAPSEYNSAAFYVLSEPDLMNHILMKYK
jgi:cytochrome o ubiquinol oxidase subunit 2